jgi:hypothetical protein
MEEPMRVDRSEWRRKHDDRRAVPLVPSPEAHFFPETRQDLVEIVVRSLAEQDKQVRASGSHWALSHAAVTEQFVVETRGFSATDGFPANAFLNSTLYDVIPGCLHDAALADLVSQPERPFLGAEPDLESYNLYHVEAGVRIFELYSRLDLTSGNAGDTTPLEAHMPTSRHPLTQGVGALKGPWAMPTLGGAGGQTIVGAFSTGTHGGDQHQTPIADAVQAIHLIAPDAREYWIERGAGLDQQLHPLVDESRLRAVYPGIEVVRDNEVFQAVLVGVGRLGIIYSVVLKVVRQYGLNQVRTPARWRGVAARLLDPADTLFQSRFLQIAVNPHPSVDPAFGAVADHTCYVEQRVAVGLADSAAWQGPAQRAGANAGRRPPIGTADFQSLLCTTESVTEIVGGIKAAIAGAIAVVALIPGGILLVGPLTTLDLALTPFLFYTGTLGELVTDLCNLALSLGMPWFVSLVNDAFLSFGQPELPPPGRTDISYAIMDFYDYTDRGCVPSADSLTVSFNADDTLFLTFMDILFARVRELEAGTLTPPPPPGMPPRAVGRPMSFAGYVSLRFTGRTAALLGMQRWGRTCNIEIAGIKGIAGSDPFLRTLEADAAALGATVHWGQKHEGPLRQVEATFPDLDRWRNVLARFTDNGRLTNFSTEFSRAKGLEVVQPRAGALRLDARFVCLGEPLTVSWDARSNPRGTQLVLRLLPTAGAPADMEVGLNGTLDLRLPRGYTRVQLVAALTFGGVTRTDASPAELIGVFAPGDMVRLGGEGSCQKIDGGARWALALPQEPGAWSPRLSPSHLYLDDGRRPLVVRKEGVPDVLLTSASSGAEFLTPTTMAGDWLLMQQREGCEGEAPRLSISVRLRCS